MNGLNSNPLSDNYTGVQDRYICEIDKKQPFFDSLRQTYSTFEGWFQRSAEKQRKCWCIEDDKGMIVAICVYKPEKDVAITNDGKIVEGKLLKICTFKVDERARGKKLGERLLYIAFDYCVKNNIDWIYVHMTTSGEEQQKLAAMCKEYGFYFFGNYKKDDVYIKPMKLVEKNMGSLESLIRHYPYFQDNDSVKKFIIPIMPQYHEDLFPNFSVKKSFSFEKDKNLYCNQGSTIKKAYLCRSAIKSVKKGDVVLFYRCRDRKSIQCMGIVENAFFSDSIEEVFPLISRRTTLTRSSLTEMLKEKTLVILFRFIALDTEITSQKLSDIGIEKDLEDISEITDKQYTTLRNE